MPYKLNDNGNLMSDAGACSCPYNSPRDDADKGIGCGRWCALFEYDVKKKIVKLNCGNASYVLE